MDFNARASALFFRGEWDIPLSPKSELYIIIHVLAGISNMFSAHESSSDHQKNIMREFLDTAPVDNWHLVHPLE